MLITAAGGDDVFNILRAVFLQFFCRCLGGGGFKTIFRLFSASQKNTGLRYTASGGVFKSFSFKTCGDGYGDALRQTSTPLGGFSAFWGF